MKALEHDYPLFPTVLAFPLRVVSSSMHSRLIVTALNRVLYDEIQEGELDFFQGRMIAINIQDIGISCHFTLSSNRFIESKKMLTS